MISRSLESTAIRNDGLPLTQPSFVSIRGHCELHAHLACPLGNVRASLPDEPVPSSAALTARGSWRSSFRIYQQKEKKGKRLNFWSFADQVKPVTPTINRNKCATAEDFSLGCVFGENHRQTRNSSTYVWACMAMLRSRGIGSKELVKRSCMYSWKSTPLAEPVLS